MKESFSWCSCIMVRSLKRSAFLERLRILMRVEGARRVLSRKTWQYLRWNAKRTDFISCAVCNWRKIAITLIDPGRQPRQASMSEMA